MIGLAFRLIIYTFAAVAYVFVFLLRYAFGRVLLGLVALSVGFRALGASDPAAFVVAVFVVALLLLLSSLSGIVAWVRANKEQKEDRSLPEIAKTYQTGEALGAAEAVETEDEAFTYLLHGRSIEKAIADERRRLCALYRRKDKLQFVNDTDPQKWERFKQSKTWRGLLWEIEDTENTLARLEAASFNS